MIAKTLVTAFTAASFLVGSHASPCKVSSGTIYTSTTIGVTSTSAEAPGSTETIASTTGVSSVQDITFTISQPETNIESSTISDDVASTAVSTSGLSSSIIERSTQTSIVPEEITTTDIPTTTAEGTTTAEATTTTTTEAAAITTYLVNSGFDDEEDTAPPWTIFSSASASFSVGSDIRHDDRNSARLFYTTSQTNYIRQQFNEPIQAGIDYLATAWIRPDSGCSEAIIVCAFQTTAASSRDTFPLTSLTNKWSKISANCNYNQNQIDKGDLYLYIGFTCSSINGGNIDSVTFSKQ